MMKITQCNEVGTEFYLGCESCGETLSVMDGDAAASMLNASIQIR